MRSFDGSHVDPVHLSDIADVRQVFDRFSGEFFIADMSGRVTFLDLLNEFLDRAARTGV